MPHLGCSVIVLSMEARRPKRETQSHTKSWTLFLKTLAASSDRLTPNPKYPEALNPTYCIPVFLYIYIPYIYIYIYICIYIYNMSIYIYIYIYVCVFIYMYIQNPYGPPVTLALCCLRLKPMHQPNGRLGRAEN